MTPFRACIDLGHAGLATRLDGRQDWGRARLLGHDRGQDAINKMLLWIPCPPNSGYLRHMTILFVNRLTVIDCSYLSPTRDFAEESWQADVELWGLLMSRIGDAVGRPFGIAGSRRRERSRARRRNHP